jgi:hypothetical protein
MSDSNPPEAPESLPQYLAEGIPKQDDETLRDMLGYVEQLIDHRDREVDVDDIPDDADPVDTESNGKGIIVEEKVKCGDESCHCMNGGDKHGPYKYRYYYENGTLTSEYADG